MTDQHERQQRQDTQDTQDTQAPPQLDFPQILLDVSLESLLSHSNASTMTSTALEPTVEPENLLSESWATLSNSDYSREDDLRSETTDVGSLVSNNGTEDVNSIQDESESDDEDEQPSRDNDHDAEQVFHALAQPLPPASACLTHEDTSVLEEDDTNKLEFKEPRVDGWPEAGQIDVRHTMRMFSEAEARVILETMDIETTGAQLVGTVRMSMSRNSLELDRPCRVLYVGHPTARDDIVGKIGDALYARADPDSGYRHTKSLRYHIIPRHYGPGAPAGRTDLVPLQPMQVELDEITSAFYKDEHGSEIEMILEKGGPYSSRHKGPKFEITPTSPSFIPDIVLFYASDDDSPGQRQTLQCAHEFMERHHIPVMVIGGGGGGGGISWTSSSNLLSLPPQSLHICVEFEASDSQESRILRRLPVDFATFDKLDPKQLNQHLACLIDNALLTTRASLLHTASLATSETLTVKPDDVEPELKQSAVVGRMPARQYNSLLRQVLTLALSLLICGLCYAACRTTILMTSSYLVGHRDLVAPSVDLMPATSQAGVAPTPVALTSMPVAAVDASPLKSLATLAPADIRSSLSLPHDELLVNKSDRFQVQVIGDCHMIIKAPASLKVKRRDPSFKVRITRGRKILENLSLSKLFDGVYTVQIDREDAYGLLNVTITMAKAGIHEVHEVDFGTPWLKAAGWKKAASRAHEDIGTAQKFALALARHLSTVMGDQSAAAWANFTSSLRPLYGGVTQQTEAALRNARALAQVVAGRPRLVSPELRLTSPKPRLAVSTAWTKNIKFVQRSLAASSTTILRHANQWRAVTVKAVAQAQARAKQIAKERKQRRQSRKAATSNRCGRKG